MIDLLDHLLDAGHQLLLTVLQVLDVRLLLLRQLGDVGGQLIPFNETKKIELTRMLVLHFNSV